LAGEAEKTKAVSDWSLAFHGLISVNHCPVII